MAADGPGGAAAPPRRRRLVRWALAAVLVGSALAVPTVALSLATSAVQLSLSDRDAGADGVTLTVRVASDTTTPVDAVRVTLPPGAAAAPRVAGTVGLPAGRLTARGRTLSYILDHPVPVRGHPLVLVLDGLANPPQPGPQRFGVSLLRGGTTVATGSDGVRFSPADECGTYRGAGWVAAENARRGSTDWQVRDPGHPDWHPQVEGYLDTVSATCGQLVRLAANVQWHRAFRVLAYRMGYYHGALARLVWRSPWVQGLDQPAPAFLPTTRTVEAHWVPELTWRIPAGWPPGEYLLKLVTGDGAARFVPLTVRDDGSRAAVLVQSSVLTWQAYNSWGGRSMYYGPSGWIDRAARSYVASFDRPYRGWDVDPAGSGQFLRQDLPFVAWAEARGLDLTYWTDVDLDRHPGLLLHHRVLVVPGHSEYWTWRMRIGAEVARADGVNLVFLSANTSFWKARLAPDDQVAPGRRLVVYRTAALDPFRGSAHLATERWLHTPPGRPEQELVGVMTACVYPDADGVVDDASAWVFAGTGVRSGQHVRDLVTGEDDMVYPGVGPPVQVLASAVFPCASRGGRPSGWDMTYYTAPSGAGVFATGTMSWECGLFRTCPTDPGDRVLQRFVSTVTANVLAVFSRGPAGLTRPAVPTPLARRVSTQPARGD